MGLPRAATNLYPSPLAFDQETHQHWTYIYPDRLSVLYFLAVHFVLQLSSDKSEHIFPATEKASASCIVDGRLPVVSIQESQADISPAPVSYRSFRAHAAVPPHHARVA